MNRIVLFSNPYRKLLFQVSCQKFISTRDIMKHEKYNSKKAYASFMNERKRLSHNPYWKWQILMLASIPFLVLLTSDFFKYLAPSDHDNCLGCQLCLSEENLQEKRELTKKTLKAVPDPELRVGTRDKPTKNFIEDDEESKREKIQFE